MNKPSLIKTILWALIPIVLGVGLGFLSLGGAQAASTRALQIKQAFAETIDSISLEIGRLTDRTNQASAYRPIELPENASYFVTNPEETLDLSATSVVVGDANTGEIIYQKNPHSIYPIASVSKLMTALAALEHMDQSKATKASRKALSTLGERGKLRINETIRLGDLLYPLLLVSSNDAAEVIAEEYNRNAFIGLMNKEAASIGLENTSFEDPSGLSPNNISSAFDLFQLTSYLFNYHQVVFDITKLQTYTDGKRTWNNINPFSDHRAFIGGKTGFTNAAGRTGVYVFSLSVPGFENRNIAISLLQSDDRTGDINKILQYIENNIEYNYTSIIEARTNGVTTLGFVGDIMMDRGVESSVKNNFGGDFSRLFKNAKQIQEADILFGNLEGPISDKGRNVGSRFSFRMDPIVATTLKKAGFDIVSFANNHVGDWSIDAFTDTLSRLQNAGILFTGAGDTYQDAVEPTIIEKNGTKIGYLAFTDVGPTWMEATSQTAGTVLANDENLDQIILNADEKVDFLITSFHWGNEYVEFNQRQENLAHKAIDNGSDLVIGHHPHVEQAIEYYNEVPIAYSLGNFIFDQYFSEETMRGLYLEVDISSNNIQDLRVYDSFQDTDYSIREITRRQRTAPLEIRELDENRHEFKETLESFDGEVLGEQSEQQTIIQSARTNNPNYYHLWLPDTVHLSLAAGQTLRKRVKKNLDSVLTQFDLYGTQLIDPSQATIDWETLTKQDPGTAAKTLLEQDSPVFIIVRDSNKSVTRLEKLLSAIQDLQMQTFEATILQNPTCEMPDVIYEDIVFEKDAPLPNDFIPADLVSITNTVPTKEGRNLCLTKDAAHAFVSMYNKALQDGVTLTPTSAFRSYAIQDYLYEQWREKNPDAILKAVAHPGESEHQLGTAIDITSPDINNYSASRLFTQTKEYTWLRNHAHHFGFYLSYPEGSEEETGYIFESWHWRYLGK
jgi:D-alanyl-D-alanine carboxypeptidase/LAS superfamily LD-carboxypeptidase LdcB